MLFYIVLASFALLVGLIIVCCCCSCKKKKRRDQRQVEIRDWWRGGPQSRSLDTEFGDIAFEDTRKNRSVTANGSEVNKNHIRITNPQAVKGKLYNQDYEEITENVLRTGILFKDTLVKLKSYSILKSIKLHGIINCQFPPDKYSISFNGKLNGEDASNFKWKRVKYLFDDPQMIKHGHTKNDVNQGKLFSSLGRKTQAF